MSDRPELREIEKLFSRATSYQKMERLLKRKRLTVDQFCHQAGVPFETIGVAQSMLEEGVGTGRAEISDYIDVIYGELLYRRICR